MATIIAVRQSNNTASQSGGSTNNANGYTSIDFCMINKKFYHFIFSEPETTIVATIYDVSGGGTSGGPPCSSHTVVDDPLRSVNSSGVGGTCDNGPLFNTSIGGRWIRFTGIGGSNIPSYSPGFQHCGAYLAGWSNMTLPTTTNTSANGILCFETLVKECGFVASVTVVNCASFYVYFLPPVTFCNARYCTI